MECELGPHTAKPIRAAHDDLHTTLGAMLNTLDLSVRDRFISAIGQLIDTPYTNIHLQRTKSMTPVLLGGLRRRHRHERLAGMVVHSTEFARPLVLPVFCLDQHPPQPRSSRHDDLFVPQGRLNGGHSATEELILRRLHQSSRS